MDPEEVLKDIASPENYSGQSSAVIPELQVTSQNQKTDTEYSAWHKFSWRRACLSSSRIPQNPVARP